MLIVALRKAANIPIGFRQSGFTKKLATSTGVVMRLTKNYFEFYSPYLGRNIFVENFNAKSLRARIEHLKDEQVNASDKYWHILQANVDALELVLALKCQGACRMHDKL